MIVKNDIILILIIIDIIILIISVIDVIILIVEIIGVISTLIIVILIHIFIKYIWILSKQFLHIYTNLTFECSRAAYRRIFYRFIII